MGCVGYLLCLIDVSFLLCLVKGGIGRNDGFIATGSSSSLLLHFGVSYKFYLFQIIY